MCSPFYRCKSGGCKTSPVFCAKEFEKKFDRSLIISCKNCKFGFTQVLICKPFDKHGRPFPTTFWLTCPYLIKQAGKIESEGGVHDLERYIISKGLKREWQKYNLIHQELRLKLLNKNLIKFMRKYHNKVFKSLIRSGIGGIKYDNENVFVKCLHLQTASYLGLGFHFAEEWLNEKGLKIDCECGKSL